MKLFSKTLTQYVTQICQSTLLGQSENKELRIFISSIPPETIYEFGSELTDYFKSGKKNIKFIFKAGYPLLTEWQASDQMTNNTIQQILENKWVDEQNKLTHYRNLNLSDYPGEDYLIVILIGVEKATDSSSLKDFFILDTESVWKNQMKKSFLPWIEEILNQYNIPSENSQREKINELLKTLFSFCVEDLLKIASFLESLDFNTAQDGKDAIRVITDNLDFWGLPKLNDIPARKKDSDYIKAGISFFNYEKYLKEYEKNKALKKIEAFRKKYEEGNIVPDYSGEFSDIEDLLKCLESYIQKNRKEDRDRLLKTNFVFIKDKILDIKQKGPGPKPRSKSIQKLDAPPLEMILTALWLTIEEFIKAYDSPPVSLINNIRIKAIKFRHDFEEKESINARNLIRGCLGGIDKFIEKHLKIEADNDGIPIEIELKSSLCPVDEDDKPVLEKSGASVPGFQFRVIFETDIEDDFEKNFQWLLPATQPYRILWNLTCAVDEQMKQEKEQCLPVFHIPTYNEIFMASDEEEANRVLKLGINDLSITNLLTAPGLQPQDPLFSSLKDMAYEFGNYIEHKIEHGYFSAIEDPRAKFYDKTLKAMEAYTKNPETHFQTQLAPLLYKAFLILHTPKDSTDFSYWDPYMESVIVIGLHPAMLEMLRHQHTFLIESFREKFKKALTCSGGMKITGRMWDDALDFATIHYPLFGLLVNQNKELDTRVRSMGLLHLIGEPRPTGSTLSAKVLLRNDNLEDEGLSDTDLFKETRLSSIVSRILEEYTQVHPHSHDGISIAVLNVTDIQATIAGIDDFIKKLLKKQGENYKDQELPPYHLSLILFMQSTDNQTVARYMQEWRKRWESVQESKKYEYYQRCRLSVSQRIVGRKDWQKDYLDIISKSDFETDIAILPHFITAGKMGNEFREIKPFKTDYRSLKYPFIEIPGCLENNPSVINQRKRIISNRQFRIASLHSEIGVRLKQPAEPGKEHVVISQGDYRPWMEITDKLHKKASWVLCIDSSIDEKLIAQTMGNAGKKSREIIGFASGLGAHGELNYTISTERTSLKDIEVKIKRHLQRLFIDWTQEDCEKAATLLVRESRSLSGLSLVRATGPSESVRDLIGYTLIKMSQPKVKKDGLFLCDELISLDTFQHWFNNAENKKRTDLLRITAYLSPDHQIHISAGLIESKLAKMSGSYLEAAHMQIENSLNHLIQCFHPRKKKNIRFDQRYWWAQLLRLIASKSMVSTQDQMPVSTALEDLADGYFTIEWQANAAVYWTDQPEDEYSKLATWTFQYEDQELDIDAISCGNKLIHRLCCNKEEILFPLNDSCIVLDAQSYEKNDLNEAKENVPETIVNENLTKKKPEPIQEKTDEKPVINVEEIKASDTDNEIPKRIFLGISHPNREIFWEFGHPELTNRHLLIFGKSGVGKTYAIQTLLHELGSNNQNTIIIDYTDGFLPNQLEGIFKESNNPATFLVRQQPLPINPFRRQVKIIEGFDPLPDNSHTVAGRVTSVFNSVYSTIGEQQRAVLTETIAQGLDSIGESFDLKKLLEQLKDEGNTGIALANKIAPLVNENLFGSSDQGSWNTLYDDENQKVNIMQLAGIARDIARIATEFILWDIYDFATNSGTKNRPLPIVLDEIQNLDHRLDSPLGKALTEGRKFGISLILATQTLSNLKQDEKDRLFQASHKLFFKPAETEVKEYAKILEQAGGEKADIWVSKLNKLGKGECYSLGPSLNSGTGRLDDKAFKIKITSFEERIKRQGYNG